MYELPNKITNYRMIEGADLIVNVKTRAFSEKEKEGIKEYYIETTGDKLHLHKLVTDGVVQSEVFIKNQKELIHYNFDTQTLRSNRNIKKWIDNNNVVLELENECHGKVTITLSHYSNPQVFSGIYVKLERKENVHGLLVDVYETSDYELETLYSRNELEEGTKCVAKVNTVLRKV